MPDVLSSGVRPLRATYRLQFNEHFRFVDALALVPYFAGLGISHLYASPLFQAAAHSVHGYDVCDFSRLNPEIGTEAELQSLVEALHARGMGLVIDIVPNHMGIAAPVENGWWWDVLKHGRASRFAGHFDIDWEPADSERRPPARLEGSAGVQALACPGGTLKRELQRAVPEAGAPILRGKVLVPVLGEALERVVERGELKLKDRSGEPVLSYFEHQFPIAPDFLRDGRHLPDVERNPPAMKELLQRQHYVLAPYWEADERLNYRRFFAVNTLVAVREEDPKVFDDVHSLLRQWIDRGWVDGLRVDHPDGLRLPENYLERLRALALKAWIVVEKILQPKESVPGDWPVEGTVGYDFLNQVNGLFVDRRNERALTDFYAEFTGEPVDSGRLVQDKKRQVLQTLFTTEVNRLVEMLVQIAIRRDEAGDELERRHPCRQVSPADKLAGTDAGAPAAAVMESAGDSTTLAPRYSEFSGGQWREALIEFAASFPVYRTYVRPAAGFVSETDFIYIQQAAARAKELRPDLAPELFECLSGVLSLFQGGSGRDALPRVLADRQVSPAIEDEFVLRFQQLTSPAMAKGVEDTAFYCLNRFASLNEVGGDPGKFGVGLDEFHAFCREQQARWPQSMLCSSTHDTKRSEDVRARLNLLSEIPEQWIQIVRHWSATNAAHRTGNFPDRNMEYLLYQTLVSAWPISMERLYAYMEKASCESKQHTDWNRRNGEYDAALKRFVEGVVADRRFTTELEQFIGSLTDAAQVNALAQTLVKLTAPGVPDIYQGNEAWDFSLVDPDNRRPVDFKERQRLLDRALTVSADGAWEQRASGLPKLWMIQRTLALRARRPDAFKGDYEPLSARGVEAEKVLAFIRGGQVITIAWRFAECRQPRQEACPALPLPPGRWRDEFTGEEFAGEITVVDLFKKFPVALLVKKEE